MSDFGKPHRAQIESRCLRDEIVEIHEELFEVQVDAADEISDVE